MGEFTLDYLLERLYNMRTESNWATQQRPKKKSAYIVQYYLDGKKSVCIYYLFGVVNIFLYVFSAANCSAALIENSIADS